MEVCDVRVKKCCHDTEIIPLPALSSRCQVWADNMTLEAMRGSLLGGVHFDQIRALLRMTSGPPQGATQSQQPLTLTDECTTAPHPDAKVKPLNSQGTSPYIGSQHLCVFAVHIQLDPAPIQPTPVYPLLHCF